MLNKEEAFEVILKEILASKIFIRRRRYIENLFKLHKDSNYISSIPLSLIQIEGVVRDLGVLKGYLENKENPEYTISSNKKAPFWDIVRALFGENAKIYGAKVRKPLTENLTGKIYKKDIRHSILHGNKLNYEDDMLSAHLIATLVSLSSEAKKLESTSKVKPYWE